MYLSDQDHVVSVVYNSMGQRVKEFTFIDMKENNNCDLNLNELESGIYTMVINDGVDEETHRFVISK